MGRFIIISLYIFLFWIILPAVLIYPSIVLDQKLDMYWHVSPVMLSVAILLTLFSSIMLALSIHQFIKFGSELPISAFRTKELIHSGLYGVWRHPIYLFYTSLFFGIGIILRSGAMICIVLPIFILAESLYIAVEEASLLARYGKEYEVYRKHTSILIPSFRHYIRFLCVLFFRFKFNFKIFHRGLMPLQPPYFLVATHRNYFDPFFIGVAITHPLYYVTTFEVFRNPFSRLFFRACYCIPRKRYLNDASATRDIITKIQEGCALVIFPEGERSWTGQIGTFKPQVLKLLKHFSSVPVVPVRIDGNYQAWPRWRKSFRRSKVTLTIQKPLYFAERISTEEIEKQLRSLLEPHDKDVQCHSTSRTEGLTRLIYRCPVCRTTIPLQSVDGTSLRCNLCKTTFLLSPDYNITYSIGSKNFNKPLHSVYEDIRIKQTDIIATKKTSEGIHKPNIREDEWIIAYGKNCHYSIEANHNMNEIATGDLTLSNRHLVVKRSQKEFSIKLDTITSVTIESNYKLQIYQEKTSTLHQLTFEDESALKWQDYLCETLKVLGRNVNRT